MEIEEVLKYFHDFGCVCVMSTVRKSVCASIDMYVCVRETLEYTTPESCSAVDVGTRLCEVLF